MKTIEQLEKRIIKLEESQYININFKRLWLFIITLICFPFILLAFVIMGTKLLYGLFLDFYYYINKVPYTRIEIIMPKIDLQVRGRS